MNSWHNQEREQICAYLKVNHEHGLNTHEAQKRLDQVGYNQLITEKKNPPWKLFIQQFQDFMVMVLIVATIISFLLGEIADSITILAIVIINAILGFIQEYRAEKSIDALKEMTAPEAWVLRDGKERKIQARDLVPGDIVLLHCGDIVPADLRLLDCSQLEIEEAALTGESFAVKKEAIQLCQPQSAIGDRKNMAYMSTVVARGQGRGIVVDTGMETEIGKIAGMIQQVEQGQTPLQMRLAQLGKWLVVFCLLIVAVVVVTGIWRGEEPYQMFLVGVSLAVAAIPEGLPAIVTVALAVGVQKMLKRRAVIRKLPAVETLGCATVICSDKTGTLTQNAMTVREIYVDGQYHSVSGIGYSPEGAIEHYQTRSKPSGGMNQLLISAALCNNAKLVKKELGLNRLSQDNKWQMIGEPTEGALVALAAKGGFWRDKIESQNKRVYEIPFDAVRKTMSVVYNSASGYTVYSKGAPDYLMDNCSLVYWQGKVQPLTPSIKQVILQENNQLAAQAMRVLGFAYRDLPAGFDCENRESEIEEQLIFVGLAGMIDPPRKEVLPAVGRCHQAGIKVVMITGDHKVTAQSIAKELAIYHEGDRVLTGAEIDELSDNQLVKVVDTVSVFARVSPNHKLRIVQALRRNGHVVAMTGDGVNDAPAIKEADIGVAMGITGTDVTKEASAMVLSDDNFATIVSAVEEGRGIYDNIRKFIRYLLSCNVGEVLTMFFASLMGLPIPLLPIQILWINLVTDGLPAMALGVDPNNKDIMSRPPRAPKESVFSHGLSYKIATRGVMIGAGTLISYILGYAISNGNLEYARTMAFTTLVFSQLFHVFDCRSEHYSIFEIGIFSNRYLIAAVLCSTFMQLAVIYIPILQGIFNTLPLDMVSWGIILAISGGLTVLFGLYRRMVR